MKKLCALILTLCLCLSLLAACGGESEPAAPQAPSVPPTAPAAEEGFRFTRENFPRMDGSTSLVPLAKAAAGVLLGESREAVAPLAEFNRTSQSYRNLMNGECDILIASWPTASVFEELDTAGFDYEMEPIATDALIFVVNEGNPVASLTTEEIIGIYTGEITNWSEVGGHDEPIAAFQRNEGAGSQALMEKLVMGDTPMMEPPTGLMATSMGELMECVRGYDNSSGAIGYSVYYYANDMRMAEGLKIIAVDGVEPTDENIRIGAYPHLSSYYTVIAGDEPEDSPARIMFDWLRGAEGQRLVQSEGYVPVMDPEDMENAAAGPAVLIHWDAIAADADAGSRYTRLSPEPITALEARDDYGAIFPFVGAVNYDEWGGQQPVYGLFDSHGRLICDPVYSDVRAAEYWGPDGSCTVPMLCLERISGEADPETEWVPTVYTLATPDGSFVSPEYDSYLTMDFGVLCRDDLESADFVVYDFEGNVLLGDGDLKSGGLHFDGVIDGSGGWLLGLFSDGGESRVYLISPEGELVAGGWFSAVFLAPDRLVVYTDSELNAAGVMDLEGNWIVPPECSSVASADGSSYLVTDAEGQCVLYDSSGAELARLEPDARCLGAGYISGTKFYRPDGGSFALEGSGWEGLYGGAGCKVIYRREGRTCTLMNVESGETLTVDGEKDAPWPELMLTGDMMGGPSTLDCLVIRESWDDGGVIGLVNSALEWYGLPIPVEDIRSISGVRDDARGVEYVRVTDRSGASTLCDADMKVVAEPGQWTAVWNGCVINTDENFCGCTDPDGRLIFRYPLLSGGD